MSKTPPGLFVVGTDTDVGKTYVATLLARAWVARGARVGVYKPAASGCRREGEQLVSADAEALWEATGRPGTLEDVCPQRFLAPLAPHQAARAEGRSIDPQRLSAGLAPWLETSDVVLVEGAGGLFSPLADDLLVADLAHEFGYPSLLVARNRLGVIHQVLATELAARHYRGGLPLAGLVLNRLPADEGDPSQATNAAEIAARSRLPLWADLPARCQALPAGVDWLGLAGCR